MHQTQESVSVAVIIPAYNQGHYLAQAIKSVLAQTYSDFEILVIDDGSTDDTAEVAASFADPRVRYLYQNNQGLSSARNTGIRNSTSRYLTFLDSDDLFLPQKLEVLVDLLEGNPDVGLVAGQAILIDEESNPVGHIFDDPLPADAKELLLGNPLHVGSVMLRRSWQKKVGYFDENLRAYEDWDYWLRLALSGCRMLSAGEPVSLYRFHSAQMTRDSIRMTRANFKVLDKVFNNPQLPESWQEMRNRAYSSGYLRAAVQSYRSSQVDAAQEHLVRAVSFDPSLLADDGQLLAKRIAGWTNLPKTDQPLRLIESVYGTLPPQLAALQRRRDSELGNIAVQQAFIAHDKRRVADALYAVRRAIQYRPTLLMNRGVLSILIKSQLALLLQDRCQWQVQDPKQSSKR